MKFIIKLIVLVLLSSQSFAQDQPTRKRTKQEKGYFNVTEIGGFFGNTKLSYLDISDTSPVNVRSLRTINGFFINPKLSLGIGIGLDGVDTKHYGFHNTFNISADARYYLKTAHDGIFFYGNIGPSIKIDDNFEEGLMANLGIGHKVTIGSSFVIVPSIGYYHQQYKKGSFTFNNQAVAFKLGFLF
jgi:hypothetical protein